MHHGTTNDSTITAVITQLHLMRASSLPSRLKSSLILGLHALAVHSWSVDVVLLWLQWAVVQALQGDESALESAFQSMWSCKEVRQQV
jgi:hypothetical protein